MESGTPGRKSTRRWLVESRAYPGIENFARARRQLGDFGWRAVIAWIELCRRAAECRHVRSPRPRFFEAVYANTVDQVMDGAGREL